MHVLFPQGNIPASGVRSPQQRMIDALQNRLQDQFSDHDALLTELEHLRSQQTLHESTAASTFQSHIFALQAQQYASPSSM
jgi:hypothetical protein